MSPFLNFTPAYVLAQRKWGLYNIGVFLLFLIVIFYTYTIARLLAVAILIIVSIFIRTLKEGSITFLFRRISILLVVLGAFIWGITAILPKNSTFLFTRIEPYLQKGNLLQQGTLSIRYIWIQNTWLLISQNDNVLLGNGFLGEQIDPGNLQISLWTADTVWVDVLYQMGVIGVLLFLSLYILWGMRALGVYFNSSGEQQFFGLVFFLMIIAEFVTGFSTWTFLDPRGYVLGLWYFAVLSAVVDQDRQRNLRIHIS